MIKFIGYYNNKLNLTGSISFFFSRIYNEICKDSDTNIFPLLTNLVQKISKNFGFEYSKETCNNFIKKNIKEYFKFENINMIKENNDLDENRESCVDNHKNEFDKINLYQIIYFLGNYFGIQIFFSG